MDPTYLQPLSTGVSPLQTGFTKRSIQAYDMLQRLYQAMEQAAHGE